MNWDAIGAVGEILGALAVVLSVIYLAVQIRRQTDQSRLAASRELAAGWSSNFDHLIEDKEIAELYLKGAADFESLPNADRIRCAALFMKMVRVTEQQYLHTKKGNIDPLFFESSDRSLIEWLRLPGAQQWWERHRPFFSDEFRAFLDTRVSNAKSQGYESSYKNENDNSNENQT